jgi:hypothetical protein
MNVDIALLALACALIQAVVALLVVYVVYSIRLRKPGTAVAAVLFAFGLLVSLIPLGVFYFYAPPWNLHLTSSGVQLNLDNCILIGGLLTLGACIIELVFALLRTRTDIRNFNTLPKPELSVFISQVFTAMLLNHVSSLGDEPLLKGDPGYVAQLLVFWWFGLFGMTMFMLILAWASRERYEEHVRKSAIAAQPAMDSAEKTA